VTGPGGGGEAADELGLTRLGDSLSAVLRRRGLEGSLQLAGVLTAWERVVGSEMAGRVRPVNVARDELVCEVDDPAWATQVRLLAGELLARLAEETGEASPARIAVRVAPRRRR